MRLASPEDDVNGEPSPPADGAKTETGHPRVPQLVVGAGSAALQAVLIWKAHLRGLTVALMTLGVVLSGAHPTVVLVRRWGSRGHLLKRLRCAVTTSDREGRSILTVGAPCTFLLGLLMVINIRSAETRDGVIALAFTALWLLSMLFTAEMARKHGPDYQLRHTGVAKVLADEFQGVAAFLLRSPAAGTTLVTKLFGVSVQDNDGLVTTTKSVRHALVVALLAFLVGANGLVGAIKATPVAGSATTTTTTPTTTSSSVLTTPSTSKPGREPGPAPITTTTTLTAVQVCGSDPGEVLAALFGPNRKTLAQAAASAIEAQGLDITGCPGAKPITVGNFTVVPLQSRGPRPSYVALDRRGIATVVEPALFPVLGEPDASAAGGFRGALASPDLITIDGPYANAARPTEATPLEERDDRKAFIVVLNYRNGSCGAAVRTEPQKQYIRLEPGVTNVVASFATARGFVLVTPTAAGYTVQAYDVDHGFQDEIFVAFNNMIATADVPAGLRASAESTDPCELGQLLEKRYPVA
jgi:hypothetical protein